MFIDIAKIKIVSGKGGDGKVGFHREKYVAAGGPDGGDGGRGGSVIFKVDDNLSTLLDFRYKKKYVAAPGEPGGGKRCKGKDGADLIIRVPRGTIIRDQKTGQVMKDMSDSEPFVAAKGGNGGWGNTHFATPTRQAPRFAKPGLPGVERDIILELKLLADVGLVGFPNVGKSTLLSMVSAARPKIANYHFTTLVPNLGVVSVGEEQNFVMADIPGIIEGASEGAGLGHDFLRHIDRCRLLLHLVDAAGSEGRDPIDDIEKINAELAGYSEFLAARPQIIVANKTDLLGDDREPVEKIRKYAEERGFLFAELSAATNQGVKELMNLTWHELQQLPPVFIYEPEFVEVEEKAATENDWTIERDGDAYVVTGAWVDKIMGSVNIDDYESRQYMDRMLQSAGIYAKLEEMGVEITEYDEAIRVVREKPLAKCNIKTMPHPGFPTDMQPQIAAVLCLADGTSIINENVWDNRFRYVEELRRLGAQISVDGKIAVIEGVKELVGAPVKAMDLRAGAAMVVAGLAARGVTEIENIEYIERGYENIVEKLQGLGADIRRVYFPEASVAQAL